MITLKTPNGISVDVPEAENEDVSSRFTIDQSEDAKEYYEKFGYVIFTGVIEKQKCKDIRKLWDEEVKSKTRFMYRQATGKSERNNFNKNKWVMNPILNIQSLNPKYFQKLRDSVVNDVLGSMSVHNCFKAIFHEPPKIVQSMYFEGNSATWEHQDSYYLDSESLGSMAAAWVALEDITAKAGRFFVCPKSHKIQLKKQNRETNIVDNHDVYIQSVVNFIKKERMEIRAPRMQAGDVLFWHAWTVHGSLKSEDVSSRSSITMHAIPASHKFQQLQTRIFDVPTDEVNGTKIWRPKDQSKLKYRIIMFLESYFPTPFYALKNFAIKALVR